MKLKPQSPPDAPRTWADLLAEQANIIAKNSEVIAEKKKRIALLEEYLRLEKHKRFGASSDKNLDQGELFNEVELAASGPHSSFRPLCSKIDQNTLNQCG